MGFVDELIEAREEAAEQIDSIPSGIELPRLCSMSDYKECPSPARFIIENLASVGDVAMLNGGSGIGKTMLALLAAISVASGRMFLGLSVEQGDVVFINPEMREETIIHRAWRLSEALMYPTNAPVYFFNTAGFSIGLEEIRSQVVSQCNTNGISPKLIVADSLYLANAGDENAAGDMTANMRELQALTLDLDAALLFIHHTTKGSQSNKAVLDQAAGSGVLGRFVSAQASLGKLDAPTHLIGSSAELVEQLPFRLEWGKARHTATPDPINLWYGYPLFRVCDDGELDEASYLEVGHKAKRDKESARKIDAVIQAIEEATKRLGRPPYAKEFVPILQGTLCLEKRACEGWVTKAGKAGKITRTDKQPYQYEVAK